MLFHVVDVVDVETFIDYPCFVDPLGEACPHYVLNDVKDALAAVVKDFKVLFLIKVLTGHRHDQVSVLAEKALFLAKKLQSDFKADGAYVELETFGESSWVKVFSQ